MEFSKIAGFFNQIEQAASRLEMTRIVAALFQSTPPEDLQPLVYLSQGTIGPNYTAPEIGLGEKLVEQTLARALGYSKGQVHGNYKKSGDLGTTAEQLSKKKTQQALFLQKLSLKKVFANLSKIARTEGRGSQELKLKLLSELITSATPLEARYLIRIVLGNLRLGIGDPTLMDALALTTLGEFRECNKGLEAQLRNRYKKEEDIERQLKMRLREHIESAYNIYSDLGKIARVLASTGLTGLDAIKITPGIPIRPTLAERLPTAEDIIKKIGKCAVEAKYDGLRCQIHKNAGTVTIFSRKQENMTAMFPEIVAGIRAQVKAKQAILEGEALAFNEKTQEYFPFQVTIQRKRKHGIIEKAAQIPLTLFVFDLMFVDGKNLMGLPFRERREALGRVVSKGQTVQLTKSIITSSPNKINQFFKACVEKGLEGVMAKDLNAPYVAGARKFAWIKLKRSYQGALHDTIDVVLIGYDAGKGKREQFGIGTLLVAVYNETNDTFESIAKIGTGLSEEKLSELEQQLKKIRVKKKPARVVSEIQPDYWVVPQYVVEVLSDEITKSPVHAAGKGQKKEGFALRFPRYLQDRQDKQPEEATSVKEVKSLYRKQKHVHSDGGAQ